MALTLTLNYKELFNVLACADCRSGRLIFDEVSAEIRCQNCDKTYKTVNGVPAFVADELIPFSEVPYADREKFLGMKRAAYGEESFVSRMYNNYHRYAAEKRRSLGVGQVTVDVGFGVGEHYPFITAQEKSDYSFIGIDLDRFKLEYFAALHPEIPVLQASAFRLPFAANSVDLVQVLATLEHFTPAGINRLLDESLRILKPGGVLIACYPAEGGLLLRLCQAVMHAYLKGRSGFDLNRGAVHGHQAGAREIRSILGGRRELERLESVFYPCGFRAVACALFVNETYRKR